MAYQLALTVVMKNWEPLELGPEFTIETTPECRDIEQAERHEEDYVLFFFSTKGMQFQAAMLQNIGPSLIPSQTVPFI